MNCRSCRWAELRSRGQGYCHGAPPQAYHLTLTAADGKRRVVPISQALQLIPAYAAAHWPPIDPSKRGCSQHHFSLTRLLQWHRLPDIEVMPPSIEQDIQP